LSGQQSTILVDLALHGQHCREGQKV